jgi:hypothetical protein
MALQIFGLQANHHPGAVITGGFESGDPTGIETIHALLTAQAHDSSFTASSATPGFRKRTSTALHALASETPTAKSKAHSHTEFGEAGP